MKQLIPQQKIDEAAFEYLYKEAGMERYSEPMITKRIFNAGIQFALNEIQPLMVEFAESIRKDNRVSDNVDGVDGWNIEHLDGDFPYYTDFKTSKQLFEEFINSKNKKK